MGLGLHDDLGLLIDRCHTLTLKEVHTSPDSYKGHLILLGGQVLKAERLKKGAQVELLQLPRSTEQKPTRDLTRSQGRALVLHQELNLARLTPGNFVTFVRRGQRGHCEKMDEDVYRYPTLTVKHWHVCSPPIFHNQRGGPYLGLFGGMGIGGGSRGGGEIRNWVLALTIFPRPSAFVQLSVEDAPSEKVRYAPRCPYHSFR